MASLQEVKKEAIEDLPVISNSLFNWTKFYNSPKGSLSYHLCFEYFSQFKIDSETYTYLAAVLKDGDVSKQAKLPIWKCFGNNPELSPVLQK